MAAGAATGTVAGPVGTAVGAAVGAVVGGLAGKGIAEAIDPTVEDAYWRDNYRSRPYASDASYDDFGPAYAYSVSRIRAIGATLRRRRVRSLARLGPCPRQVEPDLGARQARGARLVAPRSVTASSAPFRATPTATASNASQEERRLRAPLLLPAVAIGNARCLGRRFIR